MRKKQRGGKRHCSQLLCGQKARIFGGVSQAFVQVGVHVKECMSKAYKREEK